MAALQLFLLWATAFLLCHGDDNVTESTNQTLEVIQPAPVQECTDPKKVFLQCGHSCQTCENPNPPFCPLVCTSGCFCKPGFFPDKAGNCVDEDACQGANKTSASANETSANETVSARSGPFHRLKCDEKPHQEFKKCGSVCEPTCQNPTPAQCSKLCVVGCFCQEGFLRDQQGFCVTECPPAPGKTNRARLPDGGTKPRQPEVTAVENCPDGTIPIGYCLNGGCAAGLACLAKANICCSQ